MRNTTVFALVLTLLLAVPSFADREFGGRYATLMIPSDVPFTKGKFMLMTVNEANVEDDGAGGVRLNGAAITGLPRGRECTASGPFVMKKENRVRLIVNCIGLPQLHFYVAGLDNAAALDLFHRFVVSGRPDEPAARSLKEKTAARASRTFFVDDLATVGETRRAALMKNVAGIDAVGVKKTIYRDAPYLDVDLGEHANVFNTIQLNRTQRVARVISDRLLPAARRLEEGLAGIDQLSGVALTTSVAYRNFVNPNNGEAGVDKIEIFIPRAELGRLLRDDISSQQLIANSVVRLNESRIEVDLAQQ